MAMVSSPASGTERDGPGSFSLAAMIAVSAYVAAQLIADIGSVKIGRIGGMAMDLGTLVFPISFTLRDLVHKTLGRRNARAMIVIAAGINLFMAGFLALCARLPSDPAWGLHEEFSMVLAPVGRIVLASILAQVIAQWTNTELYHWFRSRVTKRRQWLRVLFSNFLSIPIDSLIFTVIAFGGALPRETVVDIFGINLAVKFGVSLIGLPLIYTVRNVDRD